jgi:hypothetical protein
MSLITFDGIVVQDGFYSFGKMAKWAKENGYIIMQKPQKEES